MSATKSLAGKICLVTGASRGIGKGIALELGGAGATVYITGRTLKPRSPDQVGGSLQETADEIQTRGGTAIPVVCDHKDVQSTLDLFKRISREQNGKLDLLVNNAYSAVDAIMKYKGVPYWEQGIEMWDEVNNVGLRNYFLCSCEAAKLMVERKKSEPKFHGVILNVSSPGGLQYLFNVAYGVGKDAVDRMAADTAVELKPYGITSLSLWPGAVATEEIVEQMKTNEGLNKMFSNAETPEFVGRVVVALMKDPNLHQYTGRILLTAELAGDYQITDIDGRVITSMRSLKFILTHLGYHRLAALCPGWLKIPYFLLSLKASRF